MNPESAPIDELIARSSVGCGLANIRENGIEAELAEMDEQITPKKKRKKSTPLTARTLAECRKRGWVAQVVERRIPFPKPQGTTIDLFGVIDVVAIVPASDGRPTAIIGIQATSGSNHASRRAKILAEDRARLWIEAARLELWTWSPRGAAGKRKLWTLRVEAFALEDWKPA